MVARRAAAASGPHRLPVGKTKTGSREKMAVDEEEGRRAITYYTVVEQAAQKAAWLALLPVTGRTHQLRVHCAELGTPILGDGKYGGPASTLVGLENARKLHLHARSISLKRPDGKTLTVTAPLPPHMQATWKFFGFPADTDGDPLRRIVVGIES
ncbi:MAG: pseudouridine synthase [Aliidongia sp.]